MPHKCEIMFKEEISKVEELIVQLRKYIDSEINLARLKVAAKTSRLFSNFLAVLFFISVFLFFLLFFSFAIAWLIGEWTGKIWIGFLVVSAFYLALGFIGWFSREKLLRIPLMNFLIRHFLPDEDEE